mgnify:CR=1 FL=1
MDGAITDIDAGLYDRDEYDWLLRQAAALRARHVTTLDFPHLAEFLEDMARREWRELKSRLTVLLLHIVKFQVQPERASRSWALTVQHQQDQLRMITTSAILRREAEAMLSDVWKRACGLASTETGVPLRSIEALSPLTLDAALEWETPTEFPAPDRPRGFWEDEEEFWS